jgi:hypothetical protein
MEAVSSISAIPNTDPSYEPWLASVRSQFAAAVGAGVPLFTTDATGLFDAFLAALPDWLRQEHTCRACRKFVETYGGLVTINPDGATVPVMWGSGAPTAYAGAEQAMRKAVARAAVTGVFVSSEKAWGMPVTGKWRHLAVTPPRVMVFKPVLLTAGQAAAAKTEDYGMLQRGLAEFPVEVVTQAHTMLTNGQMFRSEKHTGVATWLLGLHTARGSVKDHKRRANVVWLAVATAPAGFCHVRSGLIGTLLEDVQAGMPFATVKARYEAKMNPLLYQRAQAAPAAGNIAQAEKVVAQLQTAGALSRRFARLHEIVALWRPADAKPEAPAVGGVFGGVKPKGKTAPVAAAVLPPIDMTWEKFARTVLPDATSIEYVLGSRDQFYALVTAADPDAPPVLQWDSEDQRNPVSWYTSTMQSAAAWNLRHVYGQTVPVTAVALLPFQWYGDKFQNQGAGVIFTLKGCRDVRANTGTPRGGGLFTECLKSEYHAVRSTLEAYLNCAEVTGADESDACGVCVRKTETKWGATFKVTSKTGIVAMYRLDRWD